MLLWNCLVHPPRANTTHPQAWTTLHDYHPRLREIEMPAHYEQVTLTHFIYHTKI